MKKLTFRIWLLIFFVVLSLISIFGIPPLFTQSGVVVSSVGINSTLLQQGMSQGEIIKNVNGQEIKNITDFNKFVFNKFTGDDVKLEITTNKRDYIYFGNETPELIVKDIPSSNLKLGLDLSGGARALVRAENKSLTAAEVSDLVDITETRFNAFGLTDLQVTSASDLSGENFMLIEIAGSTPDDLEKLISEQGEFVAKIGNNTVFVGGERDIASVGRDAQNARIESCQGEEGSYYCTFSFTITLSPDAAEKHADITRELTVESDGYLSKNLDLFLDGNIMNSLRISAGLQGRVETQISISGSGEGATRDEALTNAEADMKQLQTVLMTGSLPYKLEIAKLDTVSPTLGEEFSKTILIAGLIAILVVSLIIFVRYKNFKSSLALVAITVSEVIIILGVASFIEWNLDLPGIAGILATIGTGIDDLIVLIDESRHGGQFMNLKQRLKRAFTIILGAYFTSLVSLLPLLWAGAGILKGFAVTTIIGITIGVFITRPAFGDILKVFKKE